MHRHLHTWHRRIGAVGALVAIYLAITGLLLNHTHDLGLDTLHTRSDVLLKLYNVSPRIGIASGTGTARTAQLGDTLFIGNDAVGTDSSILTGSVQYLGMHLVTTNQRLHIFSTDGDLVESLDTGAGIPANIERIGLALSGNVALDDGNQIVVGDEDLLSWDSFDHPVRVDWSQVRVLPPGQTRELEQIAPGAGPSWERVLQDLHSGRLFGKLGSFVIDLTGVVILMLAISGLVTLVMRKRRTRRTVDNYTAPITTE